MKKTTFFISMSLDGYIADDKGGIDWLELPMTEDDTTYEDFYKDVSAVVLGSTTYKQITTELAPDNYPYANVDSYVFSSKKHEDTEMVKFINGDIIEKIQEIQSLPGDTLWIVGGGSLAKPLIEKNLITDYYIAVMPKILGKGIPLFQEMNMEHLTLHLENTYTRNDIVYLHYTNH